MPASDAPTAPSYLAEYAPVAERVRQFYERHPSGRIVTELVRKTAREVVFRAAVYRGPDDREPAATGWACEREGDGDVNTVACLENSETSAVGRALANLGFLAGRGRPSAEEMAKASRARARLTGASPVASAEPLPNAFVAPDAPASPWPAALVADLERLLDRARRVGMRPQRAARWRVRLHVADPRYPRWTVDDLARLELWLRGWVRRRQRMRDVQGGQGMR